MEVSQNGEVGLRALGTLRRYRDYEGTPGTFIRVYPEIVSRKSQKTMASIPSR